MRPIGKQSRYFEDKIVQCMYNNQPLEDEAKSKYIVTLQNTQIHILYSNSNNVFLKLYGHKLPITSIDISSDNSLLVSGSVDKDLRLWDLQFGHCIKTIFAHSEPLTCVKFIQDTHYVLTGSKDGHLKLWDGDSYQLIIDLE